MENNSNNKTEEKLQQKTLRNGNSKRKGKKTLSCIAKELYEEPPHSEYILMQIVYNIVHSTFIWLSKLRFGQIMISILDYYMVKIENTLDFCCPDSYEFADQEVIEKHKNLSIQDRPMAWIFFIPALIFLRVLRFTLSVYCIIFGKGEVTAQQMQAKIIAFRRYYRSIRHYAVNQWTEEQKKKIEQRKSLFYWRIYYHVYEFVFMTTPRFAHHNNDENEHDQVDNKEEMGELQSVKKNGGDKEKLNMSSSSSNLDESDEDLNPMELLDKYADLNSSADPDYKPDESLNSTVDSTLGTDEERDKTESQLKLNEEDENHASNTYSSDVERSETDKSNNSISSSSLTQSQMNELEKEIMMKILDYFKENHNIQLNNDNLPEIFYSPIASPPEKAYSSDSEIPNNQQ